MHKQRFLDDLNWPAAGLPLLHENLSGELFILIILLTPLLAPLLLPLLTVCLFLDRPLLGLLHRAIHLLLLTRRFLHLHAGLVDRFFGDLDLAEGFEHGGGFYVFVERPEDVAAVFDE